LDWESFAEYMHDQGYDSEEAARIYDDAEDSGSNGEADAADTANGAEPEDECREARGILGHGLWRRREVATPISTRTLPVIPTEA